MYMSDKRSLLEKSGYSTDTCRVRFTTKNTKTLRDLIEMSIGLREAAEISDVSTVIQRFGIVDQDLLNKSSSATLSMPERKPDRTGKLRICTQQFGSFVEFDACLYISPFHFGADEGMHVARLCAGPLSILFDKHFTRATFNINFDYTDIRPFSEITRYGRLLTILSQSDKVPYFELVIDQSKAWTSPVEVTSDFLEDHSWIKEDARTIQKTDLILDYFEIDKSTPMNMLSIIKAKSLISSYSQILTDSKTAFKAVFDVPPDTEAIQSEAIYISKLVFRIANMGFGLVFSLRGSVERDDQGELAMCSTSVKIEHKLVTILPDEHFLPSLCGLVAELASKLAENEYVITDPDSDRTAMN